jgi:polyvinyl alcohol dehydrogenase (cytochrome)
MYTGHIKWATQLQNWNQVGITNGSDDWNVNCFEIVSSTGVVSSGTGPNCPTNGNPVTPTGGPDYDFASSPNEITYMSSHGPKTIIGAGQKSGIYYALDPDTGALLWQTQVGPGSSLGGMEWGSASDGQRIYVSIANLNGASYGAGGKIKAGSWSALDPATGAILWQTADPNGAIDLGPLAVANGVVYAPSMGFYGAWSTSPNMFALEASTGKVVWSFAPGVSVIAGATIAENAVYWGSGYVHLSPFLGSGSITTGTFYAFSIGGF